MTKHVAQTQVSEWATRIASQLRQYLAVRDHITPDDVRLPRLTSGADIRILTLPVWSNRYQINMSDILDCLILHFFPESGKRKRQPGSLGVSLVSLTGNAAEKHLEEEVLKHPEWQHAERERLRSLLITIKPIQYTNTETPAAFLNSYTKAADSKRKLIAEQESRLATRAFRRSPFKAGV